MMIGSKYRSQWVKKEILKKCILQKAANNFHEKVICWFQIPQNVVFDTQVVIQKWTNLVLISFNIQTSTTVPTHAARNGASK